MCFIIPIFFPRLIFFVQYAILLTEPPSIPKGEWFMETLFCAFCGKQFQYAPAHPPQYCVFCGNPVMLPGQESLLSALKRQQPEQPAESLQFAYGETTPPEPNAALCSADRQAVFHGWLPDGFSGAAKTEMNLQCLDYPVLFSAMANNSAKRQTMFCRKERSYSINKLMPQGGNPFRLFDDYLDEHAAALLGTGNLRVIDRINGFDEVQKQIYDLLLKRKQQIEAQSSGQLMQFVVQGEYGADGGKLYEAEVGGKRKYLLLYTTMIADEFGSYSPQLIQSQARTNALLQNFQMRRFGGFGFPQQNMPAQMTMIDTDPAVPFGQHRSDGLSSNTITWVIFGFSGFFSEARPTRGEVRDFLMFMNSLHLTPETQQHLSQIKERLMMQHMADEQQAQQIMGHMLQDQQRSFDRRSEIMRDLNEHRENLFQQQVAADNAAFDRRSRLQHEAIMGVNTYARTDGTNVEADVRYDRVFQHENNTDLLLGAPNTADVPFGFTELERLL